MDERACPRCGGTRWNPLIDWRTRVGFSVSPVACANCGLTAQQIGIDAAIAAGAIQEHDAYVTIPADDLELELIEPIDEEHNVKIGVRLHHLPSGITVDATAYRLRADNGYAAYQALALQLLERETRRPGS